MCGISGFLAGRVDLDMGHVLRSMTDAIAHRGPDASGYWHDADDGVGIGHRRLSILDLSETGAQPMRSASARYVVAFNGEIYNFLSIRQILESIGHSFRGHSDTEVMLAAFDQWGIEASVEKFIGMFAFAVWDTRDKQLVLCRDRLGKKPLYYGFLCGGVAFGSELRCLRQFPGWTPVINRSALALYLRYNYVPSPHSIYEQVKKLPPGHILRLAVGETVRQVSLTSYWSAAASQELAIAQGFAGTAEEAENELLSLLTDAVRIRMISDVPLGAFLSGGIDSSLVVALMQSVGAARTRTFTIGFNENGYNEAVHAREIARHLATEHTEMYVSSRDALAVIPKLPAIYDEPFADASQIPTYLICAMARRDVTVALSGDGGDEGFMGYSRYILWRNLWRTSSSLPRWLTRYMARGVQSISPGRLDGLAKIAAPLLPSRFAVANPGDRLHKLVSMLDIGDPQALYRRLVSHCAEPEKLVVAGAEPQTTVFDERVSFTGINQFLDRITLLDTLTYLSDDILAKVDRASMAVSLEARAPLLDHRVLEFAWSLPVEMKLAGSSGKRILKKLLYRYVPQSLVDRPKTGFGIPLDIWLRGELREWAEDLLSPSRLRYEGFFNPVAVQKLWHEHMSGARRWHYNLWGVLMFQAWLENNGS